MLRTLFLSSILSNLISVPFVIAEEPEYTLPQEAFQLRHEIIDNPSAPEHLQQDKADSPHVSGNEAEVTCLTPIESFSLISISQPLFSPHLPASFFCPIVREMLSYYAEQGDVQMAVSVLIVLGDRIRKEIDDLTQVKRGKNTGGIGLEITWYINKVPVFQLKKTRMNEEV